MLTGEEVLAVSLVVRPYEGDSEMIKTEFGLHLVREGILKCRLKPTLARALTLINQ